MGGCDPFWKLCVVLLPTCGLAFVHICSVVALHRWWSWLLRTLAYRNGSSRSCNLLFRLLWLLPRFVLVLVINPRDSTTHIAATALKFFASRSSTRNAAVESDLLFLPGRFFTTGGVSVATAGILDGRRGSHRDVGGTLDHLKPHPWLSIAPPDTENIVDS